ncbi:MAG: hypothetical protein QNJ22_06115 [Desulfosarcinaceae bacterium]|nr:hypothetical protein [Desulfosarcinaceae bacterium]
MTHEPDARMHSAEHILNQTMVTMFACDRSFSAHLGRKKSKCDYRFHRPLTAAEIAEIQDRVNRVIESDLPVRESFVSRETAAKRYDTSKLPAKVVGDLRIIHIGAYDACPCIGPHVASTGGIGAFRITTTDYGAGTLRIRFKLSNPSR